MMRFLILRLSAIGDVVHGLPVANALRAANPQAHLSWVVEGRTADVLRGHAAIDEVINIPRGWYRSARTIWSIARRLRAGCYDVSLDLQGLTKSAALAFAAGIPRRIGFGGPAGREASRWLNNECVTPACTHVIDRNLELLRPLGIERPAVEFRLGDEPADASFAERTLDELRLQGPLAIINPGAGWKSKLWPPERFAAVAKGLATSRGVRSLVVWAPGEEHEWAGEIVRIAAGPAILAPPTTLRQLTALARRASLFVASDTGPLHLAAAVGTSCVGLFGPMPAERNGPYGSQHVALQKMRLNLSSRERKNAGPESMLAIPVDDVVAACEQILDRGLRQTA